LHALRTSLQPDAAAARRPAAQPLVPAVARAVALLDRLALQRQPMSMTRLATELALPKSSVHGLCGTLVTLGYLRREADGSVAIGPRVMSLAEAFLAGTDVVHEFDTLWRAGAPLQAPDETVVLSMLDGADVVYLAVRNGSKPLSLAFTRGMRLPAHLAATGRAMLALQDPARVRQQLSAAPLAALTPRSLTDPALVAAELAASRERGYSVDDEGVRMGVYGLAAAVLDAGGRPVAGVGVCLNKTTLDAADVARQRQRVVDAAAVLSQRLGGDVSAPSHSLQPARSA